VRGIQIDRIKAYSDGLQPKCFQIGGGSNDDGRPAIIDRLWRDICGHTEFNLTKPYVTGDTSATLAYTQTLSNGCAATWWGWQEQERPPHDQVSDEEWLANGVAYLINAVGKHTFISQGLREAAGGQGHDAKWSRAASGASTGRAFAKTAKGYFVLGPKVMEVGDIVCVLFGGKTPFCLRPWTDGQYLLVGECYVHGLMKGEAEFLDLGEESFELV
jgi:hypothetical protein